MGINSDILENRRGYLVFGLGFKDKKTVKELRKNQNLTAKELADKLKLNTIIWYIKLMTLPSGSVPQRFRHCVDVTLNNPKE